MKFKYNTPKAQNLSFLDTVKQKTTVATLFDDTGNIIAIYWVHTKKGRDGRRFIYKKKDYFVGWTLISKPEFDMENCKKQSEQYKQRMGSQVSYETPPWMPNTLSCEEQKELFDKSFMNIISQHANKIRDNYNRQISLQHVSQVGGEKTTQELPKGVSIINGHLVRHGNV